MRRSHFCWTLVRVDDLVCGSTDESFTGWVDTEVGKRFTLADFGDLTSFLGNSFEMLAERISLIHSMYISSLLKQ